MKSYKQFVQMIVASVILLLCGAILFNFLVARSINESVDRLDTLIYEMNGSYTEMELPLRVFGNILGQADNSRSNPQREEKIKAAFESNRTKFIDQAGSLVKNALLFHDLTASLSNNPLIGNNVLLNDIDASSKLINQLSSSLYNEAQSSLKHAPDFRDSSIENLEQIYHNLKPILTAVEASQNQFGNVLLRDYLITVGLIFVLLLLGVLALATLLYTFVDKDLPYVLQGFGLINHHDYDLGKLPDIKVNFSEEKKIKEMVTGVLLEQRFLNDTKQVASSSYFVDDVLENLFNSISASLKVDRVGIAFVDYDRRVISAEHGIASYEKKLLGAGFEISFENTSLTKYFETKKPKICNDVEALLQQKPNSHALRLIFEEGIQSNMVFPLIMDQTVFAFLFFSSTKKGNFNDQALQTGENIARELSALLDKSFLTKTIFSKITSTFSALVDKKDNETGGHIIRMVEYSAILARSLVNHPDECYRVTNRFVRDIENNASVHDIGKVGIPDEILKKPGKLTPVEWETMKTHAAIGGDIFKDLKENLKSFRQDFYLSAENIARSHHERWDGTGYPNGLAGQDIPLEARIVALADVFDALTSKRVYKAAYSFEESVRMINESAGTHLDPELVKVFNQELSKIRQFYEESKEQE